MRGIFALLSFFVIDLAQAELFTKIIDTGNGLATVTMFPNGEVMLYDTGHYRSASSTMTEINKLIGASTDIDLIIESHSDADHIGATSDILKSHDVKRIIRTGYKRDSDTWLVHDSEIKKASRSRGLIDTNLSKKAMQHGETIFFGEAEVTFLSGWGKPPSEWGLHGSEHRNANSIVIRISYRGKSILLPGDAVGRVEGEPDDEEAIASEKYLITKYNKSDLKSDVLVAAHHGSDDANSTSFINKVSPSWVVFSSGSGYGHPKKVTVKRFLNAGYDKKCLLRTDLGDDEKKGEWAYLSDGENGDGIGDDSIEIRISEDGALQVNYEGSGHVDCGNKKTLALRS